MKTLLILRHAKSSWDDPALADHDRPLNKRGKRDAPRMGQLLRDQGLTPDLVISSSAKRAAKTAQAVAEASGYEGEILLRDELYAAEPEAYIGVLKRLGEAHESVLVVGHNPGLEELVDLLTGESLHLPTAALAQVSLPVEEWTDLSDETRGKLVGSWNPKSLAGS